MRMLRGMIIIALAAVLASCAGDTDSGVGAVDAVTDYLQAKIDADADAIGALICAEREADIEAEARTFETVDGARLDNVECTFNEAESTVSCDGAIVATYGTEDTEFPLTEYNVVQEDGEWKWCGEAS